MNYYFQKSFFSEVWREMCGIEVGDISDQLHNPRQLSETLWLSMLPAVDKYRERYGLTLNDDIAKDNDRFRNIVERMYTINQQNADEGEWYDCWPITALEFGPTNCSLGSQVLGRTLQLAGYEVAYGMPGPMSHAVVFAKATDGTIHYLDPANGVTAEVFEEGEVDGNRAYRIETDNDKIPFRLVPVCSLEESTANTIWNLNSLKQAADYDLQGGFGVSNAQELVSRFKLNADIDYGSWALDHILPGWKSMRNHHIWQKETQDSGAKIGKALQQGTTIN